MIQLAIALIALGVATTSLILQWKATKENSQINSLIHLSALLQRKIDYNEKIIEDIKSKNGNYSALADTVNQRLRPAKREVELKLIDLLKDSSQAVSNCKSLI